MDVLVVDTTKCGDRRTAAFDPECRKRLHIFVFKEKSLGQNLRADDGSLTTPPVKSDFLHPAVLWYGLIKVDSS